MDKPDVLTELTTVSSALEGQMLVDLLLSGGIAAMLRDGALSGYGGITANPGGGAATVLVHAADLPDAQDFLRLWRVPLLEEDQAGDGAAQP